EFHIVGLETIIPLCLAIMENARFINGNYDTHFLIDELKNIRSQKSINVAEKRNVFAVAAALHHTMTNRKPKITSGNHALSNWKMTGRRAELQ
ncbi:MAG: hypothetical protein KAK01_07680, partial [Candidatus Marinimicrobia bacterium]|nr:hypothetical protein [Candidatus Neomarinimicrobiota bacterium]